MYIVVNSLIHSFSHIHSEHWAVSSMYFLLWVAVQSLHLAASSSCFLLLHLWSPDQNHWLQLGPWEQCRLSGLTPNPLNQNLHFSKIPRGFTCVWQYWRLLAHVPFQYLSYFCYLLFYWLVLTCWNWALYFPPAVLSFSVKWRSWWNRQPEVQRDSLARFLWSYISG